MMHPLTVFSKYCGVIAIFPFMLLLMCFFGSSSGHRVARKEWLLAAASGFAWICSTLMFISLK